MCDRTNIWRVVQIMKILASQQFLSLKVKYPTLYTVVNFLSLYCSLNIITNSHTYKKQQPKLQSLNVYLYNYR